MRAFLALPLSILVIVTSCAQERLTTFIGPNNTNINYVGRVNTQKDSITVYWPGTSIEIRFKGTGVNFMMRDEHAENYFNIEMDGDSVSVVKIDSVKKLYAIAQGLKNGEHTIRLIKRSEWDQGKTWFYGLEVEGTLLPPIKRKRTIEFFGNSITAGYAIEDTTGRDSPTGLNTNNYNTYASLTARHFNANCYLTIKSGIGIMVSWFPLIMPEMYNRLDPTDSTSRWNFSLVQPDVVVINLFQNDSWLIEKPEHPSYIQRFHNKRPDEEMIIRAYESFVKDVRKVYPRAYIICALGSMDAARENSPWPSYIQAAVKHTGDHKISTHFFPYIKRNGHPTEEDNKVMADSLIRFIHTTVGW
jgi:hypothetical protein